MKTPMKAHPSSLIARNGLIARIKVAQKRQGLDDATYRALLTRLTGKASLTAMTAFEMQAVRAEFDRLAYGAARPAVALATPQMRMAQALWISLWNLGAVDDRHDTALAAFIKRQTGLDSPAWLKKPADARKVIEALKDMCARQGVAFGDHRLAARDVVLAQWRKLENMEAIGLDGNGMAYGLADFMRTQSLDEAKMGNGHWAELSRLLGTMVRTAKAKHRRAA